MTSSNNCLETTYLSIHLTPQDPYEGHFIIAVLQMRKRAERQARDRPAQSILDVFHEIGLEHKTARVEATLSQHSPDTSLLR